MKAWISVQLLTLTLTPAGPAPLKHSSFVTQQHRAGNVTFLILKDPEISSFLLR